MRARVIPKDSNLALSLGNTSQCEYSATKVIRKSRRASEFPKPKVVRAEVVVLVADAAPIPLDAEVEARIQPDEAAAQRIQLGAPVAETLPPDVVLLTHLAAVVVAAGKKTNRRGFTAPSPPSSLPRSWHQRPRVPSPQPLSALESAAC